MTAATKTLQLKIVSTFAGGEVLSKLDKDLKDVNATLQKLTTTTKIAEDGSRSFIHVMELEGQTAQDLATSVAATNKLRAEGSKTVTKEVLVNETELARQTELLRKEKLKKAQSTSNRLVALTKDEVKLRKLIIENGSRDITVVRQQQSIKAKAIATELATSLAAIDKKVASGGSAFAAIAQRTKALSRYRRELDIVHKETDQANKRHELQQFAIAEAQKKITTQQKKQIAHQKTYNKLITKTKAGIHSLVDVNKSLTRHIFDVVAGYRLVNAIINNIQRAILSIPKAGIEQQANIASITGVFGTAGAKKELDFVREIADAYGLSLQALESSFAKFAPSAKLAGASLSEVNQIFDDFSAVGTVLHKTPDQMQAIFLALEQMFAKGVVQSEEIKKQLGNQLPAAVEIAAEAVGRTPAAFIKAMEQNLIIASEAVPKIAAKYREIFAPEEVLESISKQLLSNYQRLITRYTDLNRELFAKGKDTLNTGLAFLNQGLDALIENLSGTIQVAKSLALVLVTRLVVALNSSTIATLKAVTANTRLAFSYKGLSGALTTGSTEFGLFLRRITGLPVPVLVSVAALAGLTASIARLGGVQVEYGKGSSALIQIQKELTTAWGTALIEQEKTTSSTTTLLKEQREEAVESANRALDSFDELALRSNAFFLRIGEDSVSLSEFTVAAWDFAIEGMSSALDRFHSQYEDQIGGVGAGLTAIWDGFVESAKNTGSVAASWVDGVLKGWKGLSAGAAKTVEILFNKATKSSQKLKEASTSTLEQITLAASEAISSYTGIAESLAEVVDTATSAAESTVAAIAKRAVEARVTELKAQLADMKLSYSEALEEQAKADSSAAVKKAVNQATLLAELDRTQENFYNKALLDLNAVKEKELAIAEGNLELIRLANEKHYKAIGDLTNSYGNLTIGWVAARVEATQKGLDEETKALKNALGQRTDATIAEAAKQEAAYERVAEAARKSTSLSRLRQEAEVVFLASGSGNTGQFKEHDIEKIMKDLAKGQGFATGGSFVVGGTGGTDTTPVNFMATRGERVTIETPQQQQASSNSSINIENVNLPNVSDATSFVEELKQMLRINPSLLETTGARAG